MKSAVETLNPTRVKLTVEVPFEELKPSLDAAYKTIGSADPGARLPQGQGPGADHRPARRPRRRARRRPSTRPCPRFYGQAVEENEVRPLGQPEVDVTEVPAEDGQDLKFTVEVDVRPELELPDYDGLDRRGRRRAEATDDDVDERLTDAARALRHPHRRRARRRRPATSSRSTSSAEIDDEEIDAVKRRLLRGRLRQHARRPRRGPRRHDRRRDQDLHRPAGRWRPRGPGRRRHRHRAVGQGARAARRSTTTSPSWPPSSTRSTSCAADLTGPGRAGQALRAGRPGPRQGARAPARDRRDPRARRASSRPRCTATSRARTASRTTSTAPRSTRAPARRSSAQFLLDAIAEKEEVNVEQQELIEYLVMTAAAVRHGPQRVRQGGRRGRPDPRDGGRGRPPQGARRRSWRRPRSSTPTATRSTSTP